MFASGMIESRVLHFIAATLISLSLNKQTQIFNKLQNKTNKQTNKQASKQLNNVLTLVISSGIRTEDSRCEL
jgi:hypothetical protein